MLSELHKKSQCTVILQLPGVMNPGEELKMVTAKSPLVLSILRVRRRCAVFLARFASEASPATLPSGQVMAYEFMWTPNCAARGAKEGHHAEQSRIVLSRAHLLSGS